MSRDILVAEIPTVLRAELYAVAALAGATLVVVGRALQFPTIPITIAGAALCFGLRFMAIRYGWHLPMACQSDQSTFGDAPPTTRTTSKVASPNNGEEADLL